MYREVAKEALEKLQRLNYRAKPDFGCQKEIEDLIDMVVHECKSTYLRYEEGKNKIAVHESQLTINAVRGIIRTLMINGGYIPKEVMQNAIYGLNSFLGFYDDIRIDKGIDSETAKQMAYACNFVDERELQPIGEITEELEKIYRPYAEELIFEDHARKRGRFLPKQNLFRIFKEKLRHKKLTEEEFVKQYAQVLQKYSGVKDEETLMASARYKVKYICTENFKQIVLKHIKEGSAITIIDDTKDEYHTLVDQIVNEITESAYTNIPNINCILQDVNQIYSDVSAQLEAYSTDITDMSAKQIEDKIKQINKKALSEEALADLDKSGYRKIDVKIGKGEKSKKTKLLEKEHVEEAMRLLTEQISELVRKDNAITDEEFLKQANCFVYRFIRIHPFPDANGRTSRALMNMMTISRNILVPFPKGEKGEYIKAMETTSQDIGYQEENGYLQSLYTDSKQALEMEKEKTGSIYKYICKNAIIGNDGPEIDSFKNSPPELVL